MSKRLISLFVCIAVLFSLCSCGFSQEIEDSAPPQVQITDSALSVHFIDVGQGDCTLLQSGDCFMLIDAGEKEYGDYVCAYIESLGTDTLDYVIATHPHADHCGGLTQVINTFECKNFITTETDQQTDTWINVLLAVDKNNVNYIDAVVGDTYTLGQAVFEILGPYSDDYEEYNNYSVVVKATCGDTSFLFTGDAETIAENEMLSNGADLCADVLKVGHHGSHTSSSNKFLQAVDPDYAVISCGYRNEYGHPHTEVMKSLNERNITIYRTDLSGTVIAHTDKKNISFECKDTSVDATTSQTDSPAQPDKENTENQSSDYPYIGNKNSMKFHLSSCESANTMKEKNKVYFNTREEAINDGYIPCKSCNP